MLEPEGTAGRRGGVPAWADRLALQPAAHRAPLPRARLRRGRDPAARPRHRAGGLTDVEWEDWLAATRLAVREARRRIGPTRPLHLVGFSNGGALAMKYALDALEDPQLTRPDRLVLISPMIGITAFARFAGLAGLPAFLPALRQGRLARHPARVQPVQVQLVPDQRRAPVLAADPGAAGADRAPGARAAGWPRLPPILTFQSVIDFTVSTRAIITSLYAHLPANGSELVLFDLNRSIKFGPLLRSAADAVLDAPSAGAAAPLPHHDHRQRCRDSERGRGTRDRGRRHDRAGAPARPALPARRVLAVPRRPAVSAERRALRLRPGSHRRFRHPARRWSRRAASAAR